MEKRLNFESLRAALEAQGLNASAVAGKLGVSREAVSKWFNGESFPRPDKLVRLGALVNLRFGDLVVRDDPDAPVVAFRRMKATKTTDRHVTRAQEMGRALRALVPFLPFESLVVLPVLKEPLVDYGYLQQATQRVRRDIGVGSTDRIDFHQLIGRFRELQTVLVPVLWGEKNRHENAVHIYLPDSQTTWVYLNLDVNVHDFLFWIAHELGHTLAPTLRADAAEDFADAFAATLLFPHELAEQAFANVAGKDKGTQINEIKRWAERHMISPYTVYCQLQAFAVHTCQEPLELEPDVHRATTKFNQAYEKVSASLFGEGQPAPEDYVRVVREVFESPFFESLGAYLRQTGHGSGGLQTILDCSAVDARAIHAEIA